MEPVKRFFIPFTEARNQPAIIVDSMYPRGLVLSHWRGAPTPVAVRGDTSADIVLNALQQGLPGLEAAAVTANHFDIDGFVGVWALLHPELALQHETLLRAVARLGDFRELDPDLPEADLALKLVCWINAREKELFYPPFGAGETEENEVVASVPKFAYFLREFAAVLQHPEKEAAVWRPEYDQVMHHSQQIRGALTHLHLFPQIGLLVIETPEPVHYYALFGPSAGFDIVLAVYSGQRYELEYKYTTWVDLESRPTLPRLTLQPLVAELNSRETSGKTWTADSITDTGPILRLAGKELRKQQRYAHPPERPIYASSIPPQEFIGLITAFFRRGYANLSPKKYWSWEEVKQLSR